jgi:two-component system, OmpR family, sensor kinase
MTYTGGPTTLWQKIRYLPERMPLRTKLISAVLVLVSLALLVITVLGNAILKDYLLAPYDSYLTAQVATPRITNDVGAYLGGNTFYPQPGFALDWVSGGHVHQVVQPTSGPAAFGPGAQPSLESGPAIQANAAWLRANSGHVITLPAQSGSGRWRVIMQTETFTNQSSGATYSGTIVLARDVSSVYTTTGQLALIDLLVGLAVLCLLGTVGYAIVRSSLRPLVDIEKTAGAIAAGDLTRRVPEGDPRTEVGRLGRSLNAMLSQIEAAFEARSRSETAARRSEERMRQFVGDASHELRTPLTAIRGFAEYYRQRGGVRSAPELEGGWPVLRAADMAAAAGRSRRLEPADLDRIMRRVEQESARMGILVEDMLLLARLDQQRPLEHKTVDLLTLAADAVHDARVVAPNRAINLSVATGAALLVNGDEVRLRQVIGNLMSNALSHTPDGTPIDVRIRSGSMAEIKAATAAAGTLAAESAAAGSEGGSARSWGREVDAQSAAVLEVTDYGPGLTQEQAEHAFERFYRADAARTTGGTGLGLAIVAGLVAAHGGAVWVRTQPGHGATFAIALPLAPEAVREAGQDEEDSVDDGDQAASPAWMDSAPTGPARDSAA